MTEESSGTDPATDPGSDPKPPSKEGGEGTKDSGVDSSDNSGGSLTEEIKEFITKTVKDAVEGIKEVVTGPSEGTQRRQDIEETAASLLRDAVSKLTPPKAEETAKEEVKNPPKPETETAPVKIRKLTKALWGEP